MSALDSLSAGVTPSAEGAPGRAASLRRGRPFLLAALLVLLNAVAVGGQAAWFHSHITNHNGPEDWIPAIAVAVVIEAIGVYLAGMAHAARMADQWSGHLQAGAYGIGVLAGALNYDHQPARPAAITFGALSAISPWLWAIYSKHVNRERIRQLDRAPSRRFWHPVRFLRVLSYAAWEGIPDMDEAVMRWELAQVPTGDDNQPVSPGATAERPKRTPAEWVALEDDLLRQGRTKSQAAAELGVSTAHLRNCRRAAA